MAWLNTLSMRPISTCSPFIIAITCESTTVDQGREFKWIKRPILPFHEKLDRSHPPRNVEGRYVQWVHKEYADSGRLQWECFSGLNDFTWSDHLNVCTDVTDLYEGKLLLAGVVVSGGPLVLLGVVRALFIGVLVCGMYQFPGILQEELGRGRVTLTFINTNISAGITHHAFSPHHFHNMSAPL